MAITHHHFSADRPVSWKFPVTVASFGTMLRSNTLYQKFFTVQTLPLIDLSGPGKQYHDILIVPGNIPEERLREHRADIVFVVLNEDEITGTENKLLQQARSVAGQTKAIGVFLFGLPAVANNISSWFGMFANRYAMPGILMRPDMKSDPLPDILEDITGSKAVFYYDLSSIDKLKFSAVDDRRGGGIKNLTPHPGNNWQAGEAGLDWTNIFNEKTDTDKQAPPDRVEQEHSPLIFHGADAMAEETAPAEENLSADDASFEFAETGDTFQGPKIIFPEEPAAEEVKEVPPEPDAPRYMQAIIDEASGVITNIKDRLFFNTDYSVQLFIGAYDPVALAAIDEFPAEIVFENKDSPREQVRIVFKTSEDKDAHPQETILFLPHKGDTNKAFFGFTTSASPSFSAEVFAYHHNRLIQKITIRAAVQDRKKIVPCPPIQVTADFCARKQLDGLDDRQVAGFSLAYETKDDGQTVTTGIADNMLFSYPASSGLSNLLDDIRNVVQGAALDLESHPEDLFHENNASLLRALAYKGGDLFRFLGAPDPGNVVQIVSNRPEFVPFDFVYTAGTPAEDAPMCPHAREALNEGKCHDCLDTGANGMPAPYICPLGFWGFSRIIERYKYDTSVTRGDKDYTIIAEPVNARKTLSILQHTLYASTSRLETATTAGLRDRVAEAVKNNVRAPGIADRADDWNIWKACVTERSHDMIILAVHIEKNEQGIDMLEIGNNDLLLRNLLTDHIRQNLKSSSPPLVCIIGCESANIEAQGFDISSQLMYTGVAAVVCNFTKIRGRQAATIITQLMELLGQNRDKEFRLGEIMLKLKQYLLASGIMVGISVYALGDADWIIKT